jgi:oxygen-dependent protoporphyrinogen oxidase
LAALPASGLASLRLGPLGERPLAGLEMIEHPPVTSLFLGYRREQVSHPLDGFGLLVPAVEKRAILGVLFSSSLFPRRAPAGHVALTVMIGGTRRPDLAALPAEQLFAAVRGDLSALLGVTGEPVFQRANFWPKAIPQYNLGYECHLEAIAACERAHPGLWIDGQVRSGISLPACIAAGEALAMRAAPI